jgi:arylformamidase
MTKGFFLFECGEAHYKADISVAHDISMVLSNTTENVRAWYQDFPKIEPVVMGDFVGEVAKGGSVNFRNIFFNPHAHGTHTESYGHITPQIYPVYKALNSFLFLAQLITLSPINQGEDKILLKQQFENALLPNVEALVIRTLPNPTDKKSRNYSHTNPPYLHVDATKHITQSGIKHLLIDTPSVDREEDGGALLSHHAFWQIPENPRSDASITELIYVPPHVSDGLYLLNLQVAAFENDAAPSRPILYPIVL